MLTLNINLKNRAATQFQNYTFNSFCNFKGKQLAAGTDGLFELGAEDDNGTDIEWFVETPVHNWGSESIKRPRFCYPTILSQGEVVLELLNKDLEVLAEIPLPSQSDSLPQTIKVTVPRTVAEKFWKFRLSGDADSSIDGLSVFFIVRPSGLSQST